VSLRRAQSLNSLTGSIPSCLTASMRVLTFLDLSRNALSGTLPPELVSPVPASLAVSVFDNQVRECWLTLRVALAPTPLTRTSHRLPARASLRSHAQLSGTVPAALASLSSLAMAYNPLLYGALPAAFTSNKLWVWSANRQGYFSYATLSGTNGPSYGAAPAYGSGALYATSVGLNRSLISILRAVQAGLDPRNTSALAASWGGTHLQPCAPWKSGNTYAGQRNTSTGFGRAWLGVACDDWDLTTVALTAKYGGLSDLDLDGLGLLGTIPVQLCQLFPSITSLDLSQNMLVGSLPACFGQQYSTVSGRFALSVFDNMVRDPGGAFMPARRRAVCCDARMLCWLLHCGQH
jgi:hypothetical protein